MTLVKAVWNNVKCAVFESKIIDEQVFFVSYSESVHWLSVCSKRKHLRSAQLKTLFIGLGELQII